MSFENDMFKKLKLNLDSNLSKRGKDSLLPKLNFLEPTFPNVLDKLDFESPKKRIKEIRSLYFFKGLFDD